MELGSTGIDVVRWQQSLIVRRRGSMLTIGDTGTQTTVIRRS